MNNLDLCSQILFKKYGDDFPWLNYVDLNQIVIKFAKDPIFNIEYGELNVNKVQQIHQKIFPIIEKIQQVKCLRALDDTSEKQTHIVHEPPPNGFEELTPTLSYKTYYVLVDSKDRDIEHWPSNNPFHFTLGPSSVNLSSTEQSNAIYRSFSDVHSITVKRVLIPYTEQMYPYLLLVINELGPNINGTNGAMNNAFGHLTNPTIVGDYAHYLFDENFESIIQMGQQSHMTKIFSPRIELSRITFSIQSPSGETVEFDSEKSVIIELQITCLRKELDNTLLIRPG